MVFLLFGAMLGFVLARTTLRYEGRCGLANMIHIRVSIMGLSLAPYENRICLEGREAFFRRRDRREWHDCFSPIPSYPGYNASFFLVLPQAVRCPIVGLLPLSLCLA